MSNQIDFALYHEFLTFKEDNVTIDPFDEVRKAALHFNFIPLINESFMHGCMLGQSIACAQLKLDLYLSG